MTITRAAPLQDRHLITVGIIPNAPSNPASLIHGLPEHIPPNISECAAWALPHRQGIATRIDGDSRLV